jgi:glycosyltransferase involved in cell wall biosynthesis
MDEQCPTVSIGLPVYNGERYLVAALESMLAQSFTDFELVISDNASTDATEEICRAYAGRDQRIRYSRNERNMGAHYNHNHVFALSRGRYFKWAGHDDMLEPDFLKCCVEVLDKDERVVLCSTGVTTIDEFGAVLRLEATREGFCSPRPHGRLRSFFEQDYYYHTIYGLMRRDVLQQTGLHKDWYGSDRSLLIEMSLYGCFYIVEERLLLLREHPGRSVHVSDKIAWFTPQLKGRFSPEYWKRIATAARMIMNAPMSYPERLLCTAEFGRRAYKRYRHWLPRLASELVRIPQNYLRH